MATGVWNIRIITDWDEIYSSSFQYQWLQWEKDDVNCNVFFHPALCMPWIETNRYFREIYPFFCISAISDIKVFFPLIISHKNWRNSFHRVAEPLGSGEFDYHDPVFVGNINKDVINSYWSHILSFIEKNLLPLVDQVLISGIREKGGENLWHSESEICPYKSLALIRDESDLLSSLNKSLRGDIRRQIKRLEDKGELDLFEYSLNDKFEVALQDLLRVHKNRWPSSFKVPEFHQQLLSNGLLYGIVSFTELRLDGKPISWHLGFKWKGKFYYYMPAISRDYYEFSPGKVHLFKLIRKCVEEGYEVFDYLRGGEDYKNHWTKEYIQLYYYEIKSNKPGSKVRNYFALNLKNRLYTKKKIKSSSERLSPDIQKRKNNVTNIHLTINKKVTWEEIFQPEFMTFWDLFYEDINNNHVFFHPAIGGAWLKTYRKLRNINPLFYIIELDQKKMLIPLIIWRKNWKNAFQVVIKPLGHSDFDYADPITIGNFRPDELNHVWNLVLNDIKRNINYDLINITGLHKYNYEKSLNFKETDKINLIDINCIKEINQYLKTLSPKQFKEIKRRYTRLKEIGKLELAQYTSDNLTEALTELGDMLEVHGNHWPKAYKAPGFHENLLRNGLKSGLVHFSAIKLDGRSISWRLGFILNSRYYSYMPAYRPEFRKYSPGTFHLLACIKYAIDKGCEVYDLLKGSEQYKEGWANKIEIIGGFVMENKGPGSKLRNTLNGIKKKLVEEM